MAVPVLKTENIVDYSKRTTKRIVFYEKSVGCFGKRNDLDHRVDCKKNVGVTHHACEAMLIGPVKISKRKTPFSALCSIINHMLTILLLTCSPNLSQINSCHDDLCIFYQTLPYERLPFASRHHLSPGGNKQAR